MSERIWDAIVIGTGIGGGTAGRALAEKGLSVLFLEKGHRGYRTEANGGAAIADPFARALRGWWPDPVKSRMNGRTTEFFAPLGAGVGGSSVFYAGALERPEPHDLDDLPGRPHPTGGWPVGYADFQPYFDAAEAMYCVSGGADPLSYVTCPMVAQPRPLPPGDDVLMEKLRRNGIHPYQMHSAIRHLDGCLECRGSKCPRDCKMDARSAGVEPALATGHAELIDRCEVIRLEMANRQVAAIHAKRDGETLVLRARQVVLAAGALSSPRLLMASGVPDASGLMGRNLMFHLNEIFAVWPGRSAGYTGPSKEVAFRDLYYAHGQRLGMVQAMGLDARYGEIMHMLRQRLARSALRNSRLLREGVRLPALLAERVLGQAKVFVGLLEDLPQASNRILFDRDRLDRITFEYQVPTELFARRRLFRRLIRRAFRGRPIMFLTHSPEPNFGHPCGTLRFGDDPATSVLDRKCRPHGLSNLFVLDASFFPTSMGVNPSLTIAANALRVVDWIGESG